MKKTIFLLIGAPFLSPTVFTIDLANNIMKALNPNEYRSFNGVVLVAKAEWVILKKPKALTVHQHFPASLLLPQYLSKLPFPIHPHILRHSTGFKLANEGRTREAFRII